jgi:hypothetical protein
MDISTVIIACSIFKPEIEYLREQGCVTTPVVYLDSMLHMYPKKLQDLLDATIQEYPHHKIILVFGDCHARMVDYDATANISRTPGLNCCEIVLGSTFYHQLRREGAFILMPEWTVRWEEVFKAYMGFKTPAQIKPFMSELHTKVVFVNTACQVIDTALIDQVTEFLGLPPQLYDCPIHELKRVLCQLTGQCSPIKT